MAKTYDQRIGSIMEEIRQLENRKKQLIQQQKKQERTARTHRLIERGAILESLMDWPESLTNEDVKAVLAVALNSEAARDTLVFVQKRQDAAVIAEQETEQEAEG